jgi:23S rRNA (uracil1939-C5)-methyltransferase
LLFAEITITTAKQNARRNGVGNCRFIAADVAETVSRLGSSVERLDLMVLNPPRKGIQTAAMEALLAANAPRIIYVSCDPKSLARDLSRIVDAGYGVRHVQPFDMFPQTAEVETVVLLNKS